MTYSRVKKTDLFSGFFFILTLYKFHLPREKKKEKKTTKVCSIEEKKKYENVLSTQSF